MRAHSGVFLAVCLLTPFPALAGNLSFDSGQTAWHSTQCVKPTPPASVLSAHPETAGNDMNALIAQHNAYVDAAQDYMDCISGEAETDQTMVNKAIAAGAQRAIADMQVEVEKASLPLRSH